MQKDLLAWLYLWGNAAHPIVRRDQHGQTQRLPGLILNPTKLTATKGPLKGPIPTAAPAARAPRPFPGRRGERAPTRARLRGGMFAAASFPYSKHERVTPEPRAGPEPSVCALPSRGNAAAAASRRGPQRVRAAGPRSSRVLCELLELVSAWSDGEWGGYFLPAAG